MRVSSIKNGWSYLLMWFSKSCVAHFYISKSMMGVTMWKDCIWSQRFFASQSALAFSRLSRAIISLQIRLRFTLQFLSSFLYLCNFKKMGCTGQIEVMICSLWKMNISELRRLKEERNSSTMIVISTKSDSYSILVLQFTLTIKKCSLVTNSSQFKHILKT